jgi:WD40 repeat protein
LPRAEPGDLESSWLWDLITHEDEPSMPLNQDKIADEKLAVIKRWIEGGDELDAVLAADINEDHTLIALGSALRIVRVFSTADSSQTHEIRKHTDWIYAVEFSPDGVLLATADRSGGLWVWEAETGREFHNLQGHKAAVTDVGWRSDSNVLASASEDGTIKLWGMENGKQLKSINAHAPGVSSLDYTHDGRLASCGRDRVAKVWDASGGAQRSFEPFGDLALEVAFTHDGGRVVAGDWTGEVRVWNTADGKQVATMSGNPPPP